ncbi:MAG: hypothetical protein H0X64_11320, partial [Gemmatimonadaceae bacterium]|nr:hypothetical protein [Gemmatimonadaceae bacterium]
ARVAIAIAAALIVLTWLYRARDVGSRHRVIACTAVLMLFFAPPALRSTGISGAPIADPMQLPYGRVRLAPLSEAEVERRVGVSVLVDLRSESLELELADWRATVYVRDTSFTAPQDNPAKLAWTSLPAMSGVRWLQPPSGQGPVSIAVSLPASQRMLLARGVDSIAIEGDLVASDATVAAAVPVLQRTRLASRGRRFFIEDLGHDGRHASVDLGTTPLCERDHRSRLSFSAEFALVHRRRGEAIPLLGGRGGGSGGSLVLPGTCMETFRQELTSEPPFGSANHPTIDASWMAGAELIAIDRVPRGRHRVRLTTVVLPDRR